jgi:hypothetical protein
LGALLDYIGRLVESVEMAVYSYVKPGAPHRFSTRFRYIEDYLLTLTSSLDTYGQAYEAGLGIGSGRETPLTIGLGRIVQTALARSHKRLGSRARQSVNLVFIPVTVSVAYSLRQQNFVGSFRRMLRSLLQVDDPKDTLALFEGVRTYCGEGLVLAERGLTQSRLVSERLSIGELLEVLSTSIRELNFLTRKLNTVLEVGSTIKTLVEKGLELNDVLVRAYLELAKVEVGKPFTELKEVELRSLYEIDRELTKSGRDLSHLVVPLALALLLSYYI